MTNISSFTVPPHLAEYNAPLAEFTASKPHFTDFVVSGLVFSQSYPDSIPKDTSRPRILLLQRAETDSYPGYWEGPGGMCERTDATLLTGVAREVLEESGLHVSRFVDLVAVDEWERVLHDEVHRVAKFTFLVEVHEADPATGSVPSADVEVGVAPERWEDGVKLEQTEHQAFVWATEEEVRASAEGEGKYKFMGNQGRNLLKAFEMSGKPSFV
ncbi:NUDIX hydrolase [Aspergillus clavatus NRRL 1]|uniref:NUDIX domain protein n=1 Tax=Aspergillus clavatus (strain ATCC 1007 / CBS 513.65 / DSM 816 / NCTC 3887 / NRRL 1 / QM 1276 / 107) TaxID=344612 RepID=A1CU34_ASPCL|nr:NUDIX domain protein [Aspergillus clavatus NRRL 1]EAW06821.1 NUDIX domain protein [Aspergillus clavatus NRRL 1]